MRRPDLSCKPAKIGPGDRSVENHKVGGFDFFGWPHSTVTDFARLRGLSTSVPRAQAV
jgi:hypothetical protein